MSGQRKKLLKLHEYSAEHDIRYKGPLSYQGLMALGWLMIVFTAVRILLSALTVSKQDPQLIHTIGPFVTVLEYLTGFSVPLMLIANFARIMNNDGEYKNLLLSNGIAAAAVFGATWLFFSRYAVGTLSMAVTEPEQVMPRLEAFFRAHNQAGFLSFNMFVDLFLCTLTMFCLNARPKRFFTGKKIVLLRLIALLPIAYEVASLWLKILAVTDRITLPFWTFPLLTVKPPITYALFVCMAVHFRGREFRFCRHGRTHREYLDYLQSNRNSLHFSIYLAVGLLIAAVADALLSNAIYWGAIRWVQADKGEAAVISWKAFEATGLGKDNDYLILIAPLMLLFSYNRVPRWKKLDSVIPVAAIIITVLLFLEAFRIAAGKLLVNYQVDLNQIDEWLQVVKSLGS